MTVTKKSNEVKDSYTVSLKGTLPSSTTNYTFSMANPIYLNPVDVNDQKCFSPNSKETTISYSLPSAKTLSRGNSITMNKVVTKNVIDVDFSYTIEFEHYFKYCMSIYKNYVENGHSHYCFYFGTKPTEENEWFGENYGDFWSYSQNSDGWITCIVTLTQFKSSKTIEVTFKLATDWTSQYEEMSYY